MLTLLNKVRYADQVLGELVLPYDQREKCRLRARLADGTEVAIFTARGTVLRGGELLATADGHAVRVVAAAERTYRVSSADAHGLLRCAYHLGNRHTQVELGAGFLRIRADAVLREMLEGLGASVVEEHAPFEPEAGAYGGGHHHHDALLAPVPLRQKIHRPGDSAP